METLKAIAGNRAALAAAFLVIGLAVGATSDDISRDTGRGEVREDSGAFKLTNPLLECDLGADMLTGSQIRPSANKIERLIEDMRARGDIVFASMYFRDLNNGAVVGVNSDEKFFPASLLKVPVMMAYYKAAESDPSILAKKVVPAKQSPMPPFTQLIPPEDQIDVNKEYTVGELVERMIRHSDNVALFTLSDVIPMGGLDKALADLHLEMPKDTYSDSLSVKEYSTFFRVLFNASYLSAESSEKALKLLSEVAYQDGIVRGVPKDVVVARKFGERETLLTDVVQLHDCGIVYYPGHPYLLCVMSRGKDLKKLESSIAEISKQVYSQVKEQAEEQAR